MSRIYFYQTPKKNVEIVTHFVICRIGATFAGVISYQASAISPNYPFIFNLLKARSL
jgi:hypothetical protein